MRGQSPNFAEANAVTARTGSGAMRAFTLIEMLVVIAIMVLVLGGAVVAYRTLFSSRSLQASANVLSARIAEARRRAVNQHQYAGVLIYRETKTARVAIAQINLSDPIAQFDDPLERYSGWLNGVSYVSAGNASLLGDRVTALNGDGTALPTVGPYRCSKSAPPDAPPDAVYWKPVGANQIDLDDSGTQLLPQGIGAQLVTALDSPAAGGGFVHRFVTFGTIVFDPQGHLYFGANLGGFTISPTSTLGILLANGATPGLEIGAANFPVNQFCSGFALYEEAIFHDKGFTIADAQRSACPVAIADDAWASDTAAASDGQSQIRHEVREEDWLASESTIYLINRFTGVTGRDL